MDAHHFDALVKTLSVSDTRRQLVTLLAALPVLGGLSGILSPDAAKERRCRRTHPDCKPKGMGAVCAGRCGPAKGRQTCGRTVDCGSCDCNPPCGECFTCQGAARTPGTCVPQQAGTPCGAEATWDNDTLQPQAGCNGSGVCATAACGRGASHARPVSTSAARGKRICPAVACRAIQPRN